MATTIERIQEYSKGVAALIGTAATEAVTLGLDKRYWWIGVIIGVLAVLGVVRSPKNREPAPPAAEEKS